LLACGGSETSTGSTGGSGAAGTGGSGGASSSSGSAHPGSPHAPPNCLEGYIACGEVCAHLDDDSRHCGACDEPCDHGSGCVGGLCVEGQGCAFPTIRCGEGCFQPRLDAANCGACDNRCADAALCVDGACHDGGGDGRSCEAALAWDTNAVNESVGFHFSPPLTDEHTFSCAGSGPLPTRWFRFTAAQEATDIEIRSSGADDYVLEVFSAASCAATSRIGCDDDGEAPDPKLKSAPTVEGAEYWVGVGVKGAWSGEPAVIRVDF
jgi:hypothetical protein